jgi:DeoR family ulaG and ulaABCDEF operon transcriptional repressor
LIVHSAAALLGRAEEIIVVADSRKLRQQSAMIVAPLAQITTLVTDSDAREEELEPLRAVGLRVVVAEIGKAAAAADNA